MKTGIIYYTDGQLNERIRNYCLATIKKNKAPDCQLVEVANLPNQPRELLSLFENIKYGIDSSSCDVFYLAEHDVLYPPGYFVEIESADFDFMFIKPGYILAPNGYGIRKAAPLSSYCATRSALLRHCDNAIQSLGVSGYMRQVEPLQSEYRIKRGARDLPFVDIRHGENYTGAREIKDAQDQIKYWPSASEMWKILKG